jgi:myo-inositol catabolism protein IolS
MGRKGLTRRQFISTVSAGAGTVLIGKAALAVPSDRLSVATGLVRLGRTGIKSTLLGMGTGYGSINPGPAVTGAGTAEPLIRQAYQKGIRFFDCADTYGTHKDVASALKGFSRESYVLSTKIWVSRGKSHEPEQPDADVVAERFRKELNTPYLDLIQIHCMTDGKWTEQQKRQMDILENLKSKKIIRAHGVSVHSLEALEACAGNPWVDVVHVRINPFGESMDKSDPALITPVIEKLHREGKGIIGMKLIGAGKFRDDPDKIDESLKYVLGLGTVDTVIIGFESPEQIDDYLARVRGTLLAGN